MGNVAISAGFYLMAKLGMHTLEEFLTRELFDVEHVEVKDGLIHTGSRPRSRMFVWQDPARKRDLIVLIGEAQPPRGKYAFCRRVIERVKELGVERVVTFAAMATEMHPAHDSRVFGAATDAASLAELKQLEIEILEDGQISGLNGILLGAAAEAGLRGICLLGEMPHILAQLPFPKASLAVLKLFTMLAELELDTGELAEQAEAVDRKLGELLSNVERAMERQSPEAEEETGGGESAESSGPTPEQIQMIERMFTQARADRSKAYELKRELDRLGLFADYQDRFLDLFKRPGE
jgi:predicted ATP-grasp superfamily ATP-dependent carboligase